MKVSNYTKFTLVSTLHVNEGAPKDDVLRFIHYLEEFEPDNEFTRISFLLHLHMRNVRADRTWHLRKQHGIWGEPTEYYDN